MTLTVIAASAFTMSPADGFGPYFSFSYRLGAALGLFLLLKQLMQGKLKFNRIILAIVVFIAVLIQVIFLIVSFRPYYTDTGYVMTMAGRLIQGNRNWFEYFSYYPNNVNITIFWSYILRPLNWFGITNYSIFVPWFQMLLLDFSIIVLSSSLILLNRSVAKIFLLVSMYYLPWFMYTLMPYNDIIAISLIMIIIALIIRLLKSDNLKKNILFGSLLALLIFISIALRQNTVIILIAFVIFIVFTQKFGIRFKTFLIGIVLLVTFLGTQGLHYVQQQAGYNQNTSLTTPTISWINMSWNPNTQGQIDGRDSFAYSNLPAKKRSSALKHELKERLKSLGFGGIVRHLQLKIAYMFSIGDSNQDIAGIQIKRPILKRESMTPPLINILGNLFQPFYLLVLIMAIYAIWQLLVKSSQIDSSIFPIAVFSSLSIIGIFTFHILFWEVRDRYALPMLPFLVILASIGVYLFGKQEQQKVDKPVQNKVMLLTAGISLVLLTIGLASDWKYTKQNNISYGSVYRSGFSLYAENQTEKVGLNSKTIYRTDTFKLDQQANTLNLELGNISTQDLKNIVLKVKRLDSNQSWNLMPSSAPKDYENNFPKGNYQIIIENKANHVIPTSILQQLQTNTLSGPTVFENGNKIPGLNLLFSFTDTNLTKKVNSKGMLLIYIFFIFVVMMAICIKQVDNRRK
ncbi:PMT family glycosyltransferase ArnT/Agl22 [Fructobacillus tropaeoli]|uniref:Involved in glycosylation of proteins and lipid IVA (ArnT) n=2 Tax=Fructobacillus tropaeoli TaxID=709323 RepID=A0ABM9MRE7_9LACO|nr:PMT family glycosyltransferase ArnT/Agl22 [Fructobacillus tropaeoli]CAK1236303.1 PMT family glycosyltransferase ArnT/Agl22 [Fructobacillus tropaeoli]CAK1250325.1 PMT family glycosyltransferase ArnT/Agl22 [Fructobacillus tropaeoli]